MFTIEGHQIGRGTKYQHSALLRKRNSAITNKKAKRCILSEILIAIIVTFPNCNFFSRFYSILCAQSHHPGQHMWNAMVIIMLLTCCMRSKYLNSFFPSITLGVQGWQTVFADLMDYESRLYKMFFYVKVYVMCEILKVIFLKRVQNQLNEN